MSFLQETLVTVAFANHTLESDRSCCWVPGVPTALFGGKCLESFEAMGMVYPETITAIAPENWCFVFWCFLPLKWPPKLFSGFSLACNVSVFNPARFGEWRSCQPSQPPDGEVPINTTKTWNIFPCWSFLSAFRIGLFSTPGPKEVGSSWR